jgi:uncharacterized protein
MVHDRYFRRRRLTILLLAMLVVSLGGCSSTAPSRFFELNPMTGPVSTVNDRNSSLTVGITKIGIPDYLNRPQIATRIGPNEIRYDEFNRWAGPLEENFSRVLVANLTRLLGTENVIIDTWLTMVPVDYQIWVEVIRLDTAPQGDVTLTAKWALYERDEKKLMTIKTFNQLETTNAAGYEAMASAASRAVAALSREIADAIRLVR